MSDCAARVSLLHIVQNHLAVHGFDFGQQHTSDIRLDVEFIPFSVIPSGIRRAIADNIFLPHNHGENFIVYTGTHDNDTTAGLIASSKPARLRYARNYLGVKRSNQLLDAFIRAAMASVAHTAIIPMQDWLGLGTECRINQPSTLGGNWEWRVSADTLKPELADRIKQITETFGR